MTTLPEPSDERILNSRWQLLEPLGGGGMSEVFRAKDLEEEHPDVVVKLLPVNRQGNKWELKAFEQEHQARIALSEHPNIVRLIERARDPETGETYLVFPYAGERLNKVLVDAGALSWDDWWVFYGRPILDALAHAHRRNVAHRDVKPDNIFVDENGFAQLGDFGTAKLTQGVSMGVTMADHISVPFAPPERDSGVHSKTRDLHAWAAMTYFAVNGTEPNGSDDKAKYRSLTKATEDAADKLDPRIHGILLTCIGRPERRPKVAGELKAKLDEICTPPQMKEVDRDVQVQVSVAPEVRDKLETLYNLYPAEVQDLLGRNLLDAVVLKSQASGKHLILGTDLALNVRVTPSGDGLRITDAVQPDAEQMERDRNRGWETTIAFTLDPLEDPSAAADGITHFLNGAQAHLDAERLDFQRRQKQRPVRKWRKVLAALREIQREREDPITYRDVRRSGQSQNQIFTLANKSTSISPGQFRMAPAEENQTFSGEVVACSPGEAVIKPSEHSARDVRLSGVLRVDNRLALMALQRQETALDSVLHNKSANPDLLALLAEPASSSRPDQIREPTPNQDIDEDKRAALVAAMGSPDLMVVKGPPGTGKTRLIAEIACQFLFQNPEGRILITSQTHAGLDNALSRIHKLDPSFRLLRIARRDDERVDDAVSDLKIDAQLESWKNDAIRSGSGWLKHWASQNGVDTDEVETAIALERLAVELERLTAAEAEAERLQDLISDERAQRVEFGSTSASAEAVRLLSEDLSSRRETVRSAESACRSTFSDLTERGTFRKEEKYRECDPATLREKAEGLAPDSEEGRKCRQLIELLGSWHARFGGTPEFEAAAISRAQVVGATCVGLASIKGLESIPFELCIIDEASRASGPELFIPMTRSKRFILVGDERQLPPYIDPDLRNQEFLDQWGLSQADVTTPFFSYLAASLPAENVRELRDQHRMHPAIGGLVSECFYEGRLRSVGTDFSLHSDLQDVLEKPVTWYSTAGLSKHSETRVGESISNEFEAAAIKEIVSKLERESARKSRRIDVAILAGYKGQCRALESRLASEIARDGALTIQVHTVDSFQGREADVVIYSVTRSNQAGKLGFLKEEPRMNVALSRAKECLVIVGDPVTVRNSQGQNPLLDVLNYIEGHPETCKTVELAP